MVSTFNTLYIKHKIVKMCLAVTCFAEAQMIPLSLSYQLMRSDSFNNFIIGNNISYLGNDIKHEIKCQLKCGRFLEKLNMICEHENCVVDM